ncbi:unnamed protein product [Dibothriocephalus latus]|uniref:Uncharacterized protein n=1 Tax=Dibothriocephalus latus TaxID=60516 RepID=A0A3P7LPX2_DIBLA|nr:unnamed protein product [Dibothriocephalus latus]
MFWYLLSTYLILCKETQRAIVENRDTIQYVSVDVSASERPSATANKAPKATADHKDVIEEVSVEVSVSEDSSATTNNSDQSRSDSDASDSDSSDSDSSDSDSSDSDSLDLDTSDNPPFTWSSSSSVSSSTSEDEDSNDVENDANDEVDDYSSFWDDMSPTHEKRASDEETKEETGKDSASGQLKRELDAVQPPEELLDGKVIVDCTLKNSGTSPIPELHVSSLAKADNDTQPETHPSLKTQLTPEAVTLDKGKYLV